MTESLSEWHLVEEYEETLAEHLLHWPIFASLSPVERSRLMPQVSERALMPGEVLASAGEPAECFFLLSAGSLQVSSHLGVQGIFADGIFAAEAGLGQAHYLYTLTAVEATQVVVINARYAPGVWSEATRQRLLLDALLRLTKPVESAPPVPEPSPVEEAQRFSWRDAIQLLGWILTMALPVLIVQWPEAQALPTNTRLFLAVFASTIMLWMFELLPDYVAGLLAVLVVLVLGITPSSVILEGFQSSGFFLALSIFALAAVVVSSGLVYRLSLWLIKKAPPTQKFYNAAVTCAGLLMTPILPSANGRVELIMPLVDDLSRTLGFRRPGPNTQQLAVSAFMGIALFSPWFLTSKSINFLVFGMLPIQIQDSFHWLNWCLAASVAGLVLLGSHLLLTQLLFRNLEEPQVDHEQVEAQWQALGPMSFAEWGAAIAILLLMLGVMTASWHSIHPAWVSLGLMLVFLGLGVLGRKDFQRQLDWPFLFMLGALIGLANAVHHLGIDQLVARELGWLTYLMRDNVHLFVAALAGMILVIRFALSINATVVLVGSLLLPIASSVGVNPWVIGFMILMFAEGFILPYQCSYYVPFAQWNRRLRLFDERRFLLFNLWTFLTRLLAIYASLPFWKALELIQ